MANHIEFREVRTVATNGQVTGIRLQYRTKDVVTVLGLNVLPLSTDWSSWTDVSVTTVSESA